MLGYTGGRFSFVSGVRENISLCIDNTTKLCCTSVLRRLIAEGLLVKSIVGSPQLLDLQYMCASSVWLPIDCCLLRHINEASFHFRGQWSRKSLAPCSQASCRSAPCSAVICHRLCGLELMLFHSTMKYGHVRIKPNFSQVLRCVTCSCLAD